MLKALPASAARVPPVVRYLLAAAIFAVALFGRFALGPHLPPGFPYVTFFPAVVVSAYVLGTGPGVLCAVLSGVASWYFFLPPERSFALDPGGVVAMALYVFVVGIDIVLIHWARMTQRRLEAERALSSNLYAHQRTLFEELQHRTANNMAFVVGLLSLQQPKAGPEGRAALQQAIDRVGTMSRIHRQLYSPDMIDRPVAEHLRTIATDIVAAAGRSDVRVEAAGAPISLPLSPLVTLSLIVAELVTNALKHAFARQGGTIELAVAREGDRVVLHFADDGAGAGPEGGQGQAGLGTMIVDSLSEQLEGRLTRTIDDKGCRVLLDFPAPAAP